MILQKNTIFCYFSQRHQQLYCNHTVHCLQLKNYHLLDLLRYRPSLHFLHLLHNEFSLKFSAFAVYLFHYLSVVWPTQLSKNYRHLPSVMLLTNENDNENNNDNTQNRYVYDADGGQNTVQRRTQKFLINLRFKYFPSE